MDSRGEKTMIVENEGKCRWSWRLWVWNENVAMKNSTKHCLPNQHRSGWQLLKAS